MNVSIRPNLSLMRRQLIEIQSPDDSFVWGLHTIERPISWQWDGDSDGWSMAHSLAYFCPSCARVWAMARLIDEPLTHPIEQPCEHHPISPWHVAGSLLVRSGLDGLPHDPILLDYLPEALVRRELHLHLAHQERYNES